MVCEITIKYFFLYFYLLTLNGARIIKTGYLRG